MKRNFTNENFERFLRQSADSLRMRPKDNVWKGIAKDLHKRKRRPDYILYLACLLSFSALGYFLSHNSITNKSVPIASAPKVVQATSNEHTASAEEAKHVSSSHSASILGKKIKKALHMQQAISSLLISNPQEMQELLPATEKDIFTPAIIDDSFDAGTFDHRTALTELPEKATVYPLSIESVVNSYIKHRSKLSWQFHFTPTVSYRKLSENKSYIHPANTFASTYTTVYNINDAVTHKPDFGFEIGLTGKYPVSKNLKLLGGLQFNVNRYDIKAFNSFTQLATIRLNNRYIADSLNTLTTYSNVNGYQSNWLQNFYFEVSAPVGIEWKLKGDDKMQFGVATTIQPTYIIGDRVYLISTDYKNYAQVPWLIRRWNINTSLETFVSYSTGHLNWQVGPQVRYQLMSSFLNKYPVNENLFDFGLKVGISLNNR